MSSPRSTTTSFVPALTVMACALEESTLASTPPPSMVSDFVRVTGPYAPGSTTLMTPPATVLPCAPWKVLQGSVRLQGSASLPTPDTQVIVAWASATVLVLRDRKSVV